MRNWNQKSCWSIISLSKVLSLPMRNWNRLGPCWYLEPVLVLSLPMRNWNDQYRSTPARQSWGSQPTFEELKLILSYCSQSWSKFSAYLWGIETPATMTKYPARCTGSQPTYEELKPEASPKAIDLAFLFSAYLWGIETGLGILALAAQFVLSLPMRNWNL